jgi:acetoacetate decarboxylase
MTKITDLKGFSYPLTPEGRSSLVGDPPWHYATEYTVVSYRADADEVARWLPDPLEPGPEPGMCYAAFSRWWSVWEKGRELPSINPGRTQYREAAIWAGCSYQGVPGQICLTIWVSEDFSMARGWFMGFPKKLGEISITEYNALNPAMREMAAGSKVTGVCSSHGEMLLRGSVLVQRRIERSELPPPLGRPLFHIRHFPSIIKGAVPSVLELVKLGSENWRWDPVVWAGTADLQFLPSEIEEHTSLAPLDIVGGYCYSNGYTFSGGEVLHDWTHDGSLRPKPTEPTG